MDPQLETLANLAADYHAKVHAHNAASDRAQALDDQASRAWDDVNAAARASQAALQALATYAEKTTPTEPIDWRAAN